MNIIRITDFSAAELDIFARLSEPQLLHYYEPEEGVFIAESSGVIGLALEAGYEPIAMLIEEKEDLCADPLLLRLGDIPIYTAPFDVLTKLTGFKLTRGALCAMRRKKLPSVAEICSGARRIAVLEDVVNPTNVGAIIRSAAALNVDAVLLTKPCSDPLYRRAARVSMGTVFQIPWTYFGREDYLTELKQLGFATAAMALTDRSVSIDHPAPAAEPRLAILLGTEGTGLSESTISAADYTIKIPMTHGVDSLNVAAASAVAFWQLCKTGTPDDKL